MLDESKKLRGYCKRRYAKNRLLYWWFWCVRSYFRSFLCANKAVKAKLKNKGTCCDVLVLHPSYNSLRLKRKQKLIDKLRASGVNVVETVALDENDIIKKKASCGPFLYGRLFRCYEGYANWLKENFNPKIIITDRNGSIYSPFLKSKTPEDPVTFHLSHAVLTAQSSRFSMLEYDYYCLYGRSSLEYLRSLSYVFGSCKIVLGGSVLFDERFKLPAADTSFPLLFLGMGPELESSPEGRKIYELVRDWQQLSGRKLYIRLHQRSKGEFWQSLSQEGIEVLPAETFQESAARVSLVLAPYTNAVVDAALLRRPVQLIAFPEERDFLQVEKYFGCRVFDFEGLDKAVNRHLNDYKKSISACTEFSEFHLGQGVNSVNYINNILLGLLGMKSTSEAIPVDQFVEISS